MLLERDGRARAAASAVIASSAARRSGFGAPQIGLVTVRPRAGETLAELAARLRADPRVVSVQRERRHAPREVPDDPALTSPESAPGTPAGTTVQWWADRMGLFEAWEANRGESALVAVIDQGIDATHPDLAGAIRGLVDLDSNAGSGPAGVDEGGHGTHVASMACAVTGNGIGIAGAGHSCGLLVIKSDLTDSSIARAIVDATDRGADSIVMSFGQDGRESAPDAIQEAIDYAFERDVVMAAAAADQPVSEQGDPANALQPTGTGPTLGSGRGLSVTAADYDGRRAPFAGFGTQISMAAYGTFRYRPAVPSGPSGIFGAFPQDTTTIEGDFPPCMCRTTFQGDDRWAYLSGTSMATPMVAAVAALLKQANPDLSATDVITLLEQTASRPPGTGWSEDLGWGILDAASAMAAARSLDRTAPRSRLRGPRRARGGASFTLRWSGTDPGPAGVVSSGIVRYELWRRVDGGRARRIGTTPGTSVRVRGRAGRTYAFFTRAIDAAGNREAAPRRADARTRVVR